MQLYKLQKQNLLVNLSYAFYILLRVMPLWIITYGWFTLMVKLTYVVADADATVQQLNHIWILKHFITQGRFTSIQQILYTNQNLLTSCDFLPGRELTRLHNFENAFYINYPK